MANRPLVLEPLTEKKYTPEAAFLPEPLVRSQVAVPPEDVSERTSAPSSEWIRSSPGGNSVKVTGTPACLLPRQGFGKTRTGDFEPEAAGPAPEITWPIVLTSTPAVA